MALQSQVTDFKYEVIVNDDASPDKTAEIIREYEKYPDIIHGFIKLKINTQKCKYYRKILFPAVKENMLQFVKEMIIGQISIKVAKTG